MILSVVPTAHDAFPHEVSHTQHNLRLNFHSTYVVSRAVPATTTKNMYASPSQSCMNYYALYHACRTKVFHAVAVKVVHDRPRSQWVATRLFVDVDTAYAQRGHIALPSGCYLVPQPQRTQPQRVIDILGCYVHKHVPPSRRLVHILHVFLVGPCSVPLLRPNVRSSHEPSAEVLRIPRC